MTPHCRNTFLLRPSHHLPRHSQSRTLEGLFVLTLCPSRALNLTLHVASGTVGKQQHCPMW